MKLFTVCLIPVNETLNLKKKRPSEDLYMSPAVVFVQTKRFQSPSSSVHTAECLHVVFHVAFVLLLCSVFWKARARYEQLGSRLVDRV